MTSPTAQESFRIGTSACRTGRSGLPTSPVRPIMFDPDHGRDTGLCRVAPPPSGVIPKIPQRWTIPEIPPLKIPQPRAAGLQVLILRKAYVPVLCQSRDPRLCRVAPPPSGVIPKIPQPSVFPRSPSRGRLGHIWGSTPWTRGPVTGLAPRAVTRPKHS